MAWGRYSSNGGFSSNQGISGRHPEKGKSYIHKESMVAHLWANQSQDMARNAKGSIYFKGNTIYSYGAHWPLGIITDRKVGEKTVVLRNTEDGGHTTNGQAWSVRSALQDHPQYEVVHCTTQQAIWWNNGEHAKALNDIVYYKLVELQSHQARLMNTRLGYYNAMEGCELALDDTELRQLANRLGVPLPEYDLAAMRQAIADTARTYREGEPKREKARAARQKRACLKVIEKWYDQHTTNRYVSYRVKVRPNELDEAITLAMNTYDIAIVQPFLDLVHKVHLKGQISDTFEVLNPDWYMRKNEYDQRKYNRRTNTLTVNQWLKGMKGRIMWDGRISSTLMRKYEGRLETTQGVEVPWAHAVRVFATAIHCHNNDREFLPPVTISIGHFTLDRIDADGTLHAGCHHLKFKDMLALACQEAPELASQVKPRYPVPAVI